MMSKPVALGSKVPQWPTFLMPNLRRIASTTSCEVRPEGLSTRMAPSSVEKSCINHQSLPRFEGPFDRRNHLALHRQWFAGNARARCSGMAATAEFAADGTDIHPVTLG